MMHFLLSISINIIFIIDLKFTNIQYHKISTLRTEILDIQFTFIKSLHKYISVSSILFNQPSIIIRMALILCLLVYYFQWFSQCDLKWFINTEQSSNIDSSHTFYQIAITDHETSSNASHTECLSKRVHW